MSLLLLSSTSSSPPFYCIYVIKLISTLQTLNCRTYCLLIISNKKANQLTIIFVLNKTWTQFIVNEIWLTSYNEQRVIILKLKLDKKMAKYSVCVWNLQCTHSCNEKMLLLIIIIILYWKSLYLYKLNLMWNFPGIKIHLPKVFFSLWFKIQPTTFLWNLIQLY